MITPYEELSTKKPEVFHNEDLLALSEDQVFALQELPFLDKINFISSGGRYLLWIDWMDEGQFKSVADTLLKED